MERIEQLELMLKIGPKVLLFAASLIPKELHTKEGAELLAEIFTRLSYVGQLLAPFYGDDEALEKLFEKTKEDG